MRPPPRWLSYALQVAGGVVLGTAWTVANYRGVAVGCIGLVVAFAALEWDRSAAYIQGYRDGRPGGHRG